MYMKVAVTPPVTGSLPAPAASSGTSGLGFVPRILRRPGLPPVLQVPVPQMIFNMPNGLGQVRVRFRGVGQTNTAYTSGPCQYQLPGVPLIPNVPVCGPGGYQMTPAQIAAVKASQAMTGTESGGAFKAGCPTDPNAVLPPGCFPGGGPNTQVQATLSPAAQAAATASLPITPTLAPGNVPPVGIQTAAPAPTGPIANLPPPGAPASTGSQSTIIGGSPFSFLEDSVNLFGFAIPVWGLLAAGGVALVVAMSHKGGR